MARCPGVALRGRCPPGPSRRAWRGCARCNSARYAGTRTCPGRCPTSSRPWLSGRGAGRQVAISSSRSWSMEAASWCQTSSDTSSAHCRSSMTKTVGAAAHSSSADARLALNPDHRSLVTTESLHTVPEDRELLAAVHPLRRPVDGPHSGNVCPAQRQCLATPGGHMCRSAHHGPFGINVLFFRRTSSGYPGRGQILRTGIRSTVAREKPVAIALLVSGVGQRDGYRAALELAPDTEDGAGSRRLTQGCGGWSARGAGPAGRRGRRRPPDESRVRTGGSNGSSGVQGRPRDHCGPTLDQAASQEARRRLVRSARVSRWAASSASVIRASVMTTARTLMGTGGRVGALPPGSGRGLALLVGPVQVAGG